MSRTRYSSSPMLSPREALVFGLGGSVQILLLLGLGGLAWLKEQPLFWRNIGGWPVWLREMVRLFFYPFLGLELVALLGFSLAITYWIGQGRLHSGAGILMLVVLWGLILAVIAIVVANNLVNLMEGRPWHWHPE